MLKIAAKTRSEAGEASPRLPEEVRRLGWVSFFTDIASEMVYPVVPLFLTAALGAPVVVLGAIEGAAEAIVSIMKGASGWHCDRLGRRVPYIRLGYGLGAASKPLMALALAWPMVFLARAVDRLGKGLRTTARDALIADAVDARMAGRAYGFHRMMDTSGAIVGVLFALLLLWLLPGQYRTIFLLATIPGAMAVWLTFRLREARKEAAGPAHACALEPEPGSAQAMPAPGDKPALARLVLPANYWWTLGVLGLFAFANSSDALLLLRAKNLGWDDTQVVLAYVLFNLTYALAAYPIGILSDRFGRWRLIIGGWLIYSLVYFGFAEASALDIWWLFPLYGLFMALTEGVGKALIAGQIPSERKGTALGIFHMSIGLIALSSSLVAGLLWDTLGPAAPFRLGGFVALLAALAAMAVAFKTKRRVVA
ncbi:MFS transporter [Desulfocurvibacter africanus]|uniref:Major facilitator superfamily MFS_1 n=1 Tax=Desulfocurvibacter africanus subsp. africanus str. Walvis Bay TaxID=690850 RepID=F3YYP9_DESAF|nr:MFS transporter [Desulfocurvibacter africanus]EGJ51875.1 major facilitator superfamily MFS_1 [Desulfocurvibacter africanus subsp. africanus str. Walvis Bay]